MICEIGCHFFPWSEAYCDPLSQRRAEALAKYIIEQGINPERIIPVGYDDRVPRILEEEKYVPMFRTSLPRGAHLSYDYINTLPTQNEKQAAFHLNRRTELVIVGMMRGE